MDLSARLQQFIERGDKAGKETLMTYRLIAIKMEQHISALEAELAKCQADYGEHVIMVARKERPAYDEQQRRINALEARFTINILDKENALRMLESVSETCKKLKAELAAVKSENERLNEKLKCTEKDYDSLRVFVQKNGITND